MMIAEKPHAIPMNPSQSGSQRQQQSMRSTKQLKSKPANQRPAQQTSNPSKVKPKQKGRSTQANGRKQQPNPQSQQFKNSNSNKKETKDSLLPSSSSPTSPSSSSIKSSNKKSLNRVVIPPRIVDVVFNTSNKSNRNSKRATLKSTADEIKQSTEDIKNLLLSDYSSPCLPDGSRPVFNQTNSSVTMVQLP